MALSWIKKVKQFKSSLRVIAGFLLRSRETQAKRVKGYQQEVQQLRKVAEQQQRTIREQQQQLAHQEGEIARLNHETRQLRARPPRLPDDPPLPRHSFGAKMISLCVNLARRIGFRPVGEVLKMVLEWLGVEAKLPDWTSIRTWMLRVGVAALGRPVEQADDWVWMADHSNQIGPEKVLSIIGVRASKMPPPGQSLKHEDVRVLELRPGTSWKREDMKAVYEQVAARCGAPLALISDGAVELRDGATMCEALQQNGKQTIVLGDFKHQAANVLKNIIGKDERFRDFSTRLGRTRSAIQQTELAHLTPPSPKAKARFMNLEATLRWAQMVLWQLSHPDSKARQGITVERLNEKLGWLRDYEEDIERWQACQEVVGASLTFINEQGVFRGAARQLRDHLRRLAAYQKGKRTQSSRQVMACLLGLVRPSEAKLTDGQRLPMSTEILESSFGLFKQREGQHSQGGFTSLIAGYGCLLHRTDPQSIRADFASVSVKSMRAWVCEKLGTTLAAKRQIAYQEYRNAS